MRADSTCAEYVDYTVWAMLAEHERGTHNHAHALWVALNLVLWLKNNRVIPLQRSLCLPCP